MITRMFPGMGTIHSITLPDDAAGPEADRAMEACRLRMQDLHRRWSAFLPESEFSRISRAAGKEPVPVSGDTFALLEAAQRLQEETGGAFSVCIGHLTLPWKEQFLRGAAADSDLGDTAGIIPADAGMQDASVQLPLRPAGRMILDPAAHTVFLPEEGTALDAGGIAKGAALSEAAGILQSHGINEARLNYGGSIGVIGTMRRVVIRLSSGCSPDTVSVRTDLPDLELIPDEQEGVLYGAFWSAPPFAVTSGSTEQEMISGGVRYSHILDPRTGRPADGAVRSITLTGHDAAELDAWATAFCVTGSELLPDMAPAHGWHYVICEDRS